MQILGFHDLRQVQHRSTWNPTPSVTSVTSVSSQHGFSMDLLSFEHKALETKPSCIGLSRSSPLRNISVGSGFGDGLFRLRVQTLTPRHSLTARNPHLIKPKASDQIKSWTRFEYLQQKLSRSNKSHEEFWFT